MDSSWLEFLSNKKNLKLTKKSKKKIITQDRYFNHYPQWMTLFPNQRSIYHLSSKLFCSLCDLPNGLDIIYSMNDPLNILCVNYYVRLVTSLNAHYPPNVDFYPTNSEEVICWVNHGIHWVIYSRIDIIYPINEPFIVYQVNYFVHYVIYPWTT